MQVTLALLLMYIRPYLFCLFMLSVCGNHLLADVSVVNYKIQLSEKFLEGQDSVVLVMQHGQYFSRFKMIAGVPTAIDISHYIPCKSGLPSFSSSEGQELLRKYNGSIYSFHYVGTNRFFSVKSVAFEDLSGKGIKEDSTYTIDYEYFSPPADELSNAINRYQAHVGRVSIFGNVNLKSMLLRGTLSRYFIETIKEIQVADFTVAELNQLLSLGLAEDGESTIVVFPGAPHSKFFRFVTEGGRVKSHTPFW